MVTLFHSKARLRLTEKLIKYSLNGLKLILYRYMLKLPDSSYTWRIAEISRRDRQNKAIPALSVFSFSANDNSMLSVDWEEKTTPENTIARVGMTYKTGTNIFKSYDNREIYSLSVSYLQTLREYISCVKHDPIFFEHEQIGKPNNPAHSLICCEAISDFDMPEFLTKLRDHAKDNRVPVDMNTVHQLVQQYRSRVIRADATEDTKER